MCVQPQNNVNKFRIGVEVETKYQTNNQAENYSIQACLACSQYTEPGIHVEIFKIVVQTYKNFKRFDTNKKVCNK